MPRKHGVSYINTDVKDPTIILTKLDSAFVQTWEERKATKLRNAIATAEVNRGKKSRKVKGGAVIDASFIRRMKALYFTAMTYRKIALELGCNRGLIDTIRKEQNWPLRIARKNDLANMKVTVRVYLKEKTIAGMDKHIMTRFSSRGQYIERLICKDLDL